MWQGDADEAIAFPLAEGLQRRIQTRFSTPLGFGSGFQGPDFRVKRPVGGFQPEAFCVLCKPLTPFDEFLRRDPTPAANLEHAAGSETVAQPLCPAFQENQRSARLQPGSDEFGINRRQVQELEAQVVDEARQPAIMDGVIVLDGHQAGVLTGDLQCPLERAAQVKLHVTAGRTALERDHKCLG